MVAASEGKTKSTARGLAMAYAERLLAVVPSPSAVKRKGERPKNAAQDFPLKIRPIQDSFTPSVKWLGIVEKMQNDDLVAPLISNLCSALANDFVCIKAGKELFHGTSVKAKGVHLKPPKLMGSKWFSPDREYASSYARWGVSNFDEAIFKCKTRTDLYLAKEAHGCAWGDVIMSELATTSHPQDNCWEIERRYFLPVITKKFRDISIAGYINHSEREYFLFECSQIIDELEVL